MDFSALVIVAYLVREYRVYNQKWAIQRNWKHKAHDTKKNKTRTQYVLDTTMRKQTQQ
jgi:hypothetical protein